MEMEPNRRRVVAPGTVQPEEMPTISGDRGLDHEENLILRTGPRWRHRRRSARQPCRRHQAGRSAPQGPVGLPGPSEPEVIRHYVRLSRMNYAIDAGLYPLGSCTMKHNPRLNEKMARLPGFGDLHPLAPRAVTQGALELISQLMTWLTTLTGMPAVAMSPKAGAHGELCGLLAIRAAIAARGEKRSRILVPESAHGTNPATAAFAGFTVDEVPAKPNGHVDAEALKAKLGPRCRRHHADQSQHMRVVRTRRRGHRQGGARGRAYVATAPISTPLPAGCGPAIWASTPCTSICTRPFPPPMAAAVQARVRWC